MQIIAASASNSLKINSSRIKFNETSSHSSNHHTPHSMSTMYLNACAEKQKQHNYNINHCCGFPELTCLFLKWVISSVLYLKGRQIDLGVKCDKMDRIGQLQLYVYI